MDRRKGKDQRRTKLDQDRSRQLKDGARSVRADQTEVHRINRSVPDAVAADGTKPPLDDETRQKNLKATAERVGGMTPEGAAEAIKQLANDGKEEMAMEVLSSLDSRKAGAILDAMKDETLAAKFIELMSNRNKQSKTATKSNIRPS